MRRLVWALTVLVALGLPFSAQAASIDVGAPALINVEDGSETPLYQVLDALLGNPGFTSINDAAGLIVDVDEYSSAGSLFNSLHREFTFDVRHAAADHVLTATSRANATSMEIFGLGDAPFSGPVTLSGVTSPFDLELGVDRPNDGTIDRTYSSDYTASNPPFANEGNQGVRMLLFDVRSIPGIGFDFIYAWEDRSDFDYNDFVGTITIVPVPPAFGLLGLGMAAVAGLRMRRAKKA